MPMQFNCYILLADGTYSGLAGCRIVTLPASYSHEEVEAALSGDPDLFPEMVTHKTFFDEDVAYIEALRQQREKPVVWQEE